MGFSSVRTFLLLFLSLPGVAGAQVKVSITPPAFVNVGGALKDLVSQQEINDLVAGPLSLYEAQASDQISGALAKPGLYAGLADAATLPLAALTRPSWDSPRFSFVLGTAVGVDSDSFDPAVLADRLRTLRPESDYRIGAAVHPLAAAVVWTPFPGTLAWSAGVFGSFSAISPGPVSLEARAGGASVHLRQALGASWGPVAWDSWTLSFGGGWASNRYDTALTLTLPTRTVPLDLTYLDAGEVVITAEPRFRLSLVNQGWLWPLQAATEVSVGRLVRLGLAAGVQVAWGSASLEVRGKNPIHLQSATSAGLYEKFLSDTAWVDVEGRWGGTLGPAVQAFGTLTPSWSVGAFRLGFPVTWRYPGGVSASLLWGVAL